jgi:hypothetical protein
MKVSSTQSSKRIADTVGYFIKTGQITKEDILNFINRFEIEALIRFKDSLCLMERIPEGYELTNSRFDFIIEYLAHRCCVLKVIVEEYDA